MNLHVQNLVISKTEKELCIDLTHEMCLKHVPFLCLIMTLHCFECCEQPG